MLKEVRISRLMCRWMWMWIWVVVCGLQVVMRVNQAPAGGSLHTADVGSKTTHRVLSRLWAMVMGQEPQV